VLASPGTQARGAGDRPFRQHAGYGRIAQGRKLGGLLADTAAAGAAAIWRARRPHRLRGGRNRLIGGWIAAGRNSDLRGIRGAASRFVLVLASGLCHRTFPAFGSAGIVAGIRNDSGIAAAARRRPRQSQSHGIDVGLPALPLPFSFAVRLGARIRAIDARATRPDAVASAEVLPEAGCGAPCEVSADEEC
jgi:hypothetical protein